MGSSPSNTRRWKPPTCSMKWKPACSSSQKRGACEQALCPEAGTLEGHRGRAGRLGRPARPGQTHARLGALGRTPPGWELGARGRGGEQCDGGNPPGWLARAHGQTADRWHPLPTGAGMSDRVLAGALQPAPVPVQCYDRKDFPRTNNEMERSIRGLKTRYRRMSGRKNWNSYLVRYGRCVAYAAWWEQDADRQCQLIERAARLDRTRWRELRRE